MNKQTKQAEAVKVTAAPTEKAETKGLTVLKPGHEPQAEETTAQVIESKRGLNLEQTLKLVEDLHLKKRQRDRLELSINELNAFNISQKNEDLDDKSYYSGCEITLKDDERRAFTTKNPVIIREVIEYLNIRFTEKLTQLEASIVLPH
jgi:hypothetical protein